MQDGQSSPPDDATDARLALHAVVASKVNFAAAQNGVSVLRELRIVNVADTLATDVSLRLTATPPILRERTWRIDRIAPGGEVSLWDLETALDTAILGGLDEAETGQIEVELRLGGAEVARSRHRIELLARDEWGGLAERENVLAAFVSPNQPLVARLLKDAARLLEASGQSGSMEGYQSGDPGRIWMMAAAIWSAATGLGLSYAVPPASFEQVGQKVRDPERIAAEGLVTCLDASLLLAAAFEAAGLHTAILFSQGHAWVGVWLTPRDFGRLVEPDVVAIRKAVAGREFMPLETTLLTKRPSIGFEAAVEAGREHLTEAREAEFVQAVDINRARAARIRPLASHRPRPDAELEDAATPAALPRLLDLGLLPGETIEETPTTALGRIERWQRKLLDLSLANRLLNFKETRLAVPMICPDVSGLEDRLAGGETFRLLALKDENALAGRDLVANEARRIEADLARDALGRGQIAVPLTGHEMTNRLTELYRKARSDAQEGGTNTLFLAAGFLRWKREEKEDRHFRAPLLLLPVKLERRSARSEFRLSQLEDEVRINATLLELLKRDFELRLPELEGELPRDASGLDIARIFEILRQRIRDVAGFEVIEECALSTFSFSKYLMWKDLVDRADSLRESRLVRHLVDNPTESFAGGAAGAMPQPADIDRRCAPGDLLVPLSADSSQLAAVLAAGQGRDFVLIGPPGTGKSQTITNIIADQLGRGRTVLFVAEKAAALDVVQRRLERHGLGDAVLELHSNKADRKAVLAQLGRSWDRAVRRDLGEWVRVTEDLRITRDELNTYADALHRPGSQGFSVFQAIGHAGEGGSAFTLSFPNKDCHDGESWRRLRALAAEVGTQYRVVANLGANLGAEGPLSLVAPGEWSFGWQDAFLATAGRLRVALARERVARHALAAVIGCPSNQADLPEVIDVLSALPVARLGRPAVAEAALADPEGLRAALPDLAAAIEECREQRARMLASYPDEVVSSIPLDTLAVRWREAQAKVWPLAGIAQGKVRKLLQAYAGTGAANPERDIPALKRLAEARARIGASPLGGVPGFAEEATNTATLVAELDEAEAYLRLEALLAGIGAPEEWRLALRGNLTLRDGGAFAPELRAFAEAEAQLRSETTAFQRVGGVIADGARSERIEGLLDALEGARAHFPNWMKWLDTRDRAMASSLSPLVEALEAGAPIEDASKAFQRAYMAWWLPLAIDASPILRGFAHWEHEERIARFRALDDAMTALAPSEVMRRLGNDLPARDGVPRNSELGQLRHQLGLQRPSIAIRALLSQMPTTFGKLAPCVLMSPLSVAQYLPAGQAAFDLVIFDEASQISTWDAIGAIARGRQAVIVGDPKQLPPTNFFGRSEDEEDEDVATHEQDMPSILDEVAAAGIPTHRLNWHYRSRDEALIAFSNRFYYDDKLVTFPSPDASGQAVRLHRIKGTYMRGKGRTNPDEARAVVRMIRARLSEWARLAEDKRPTLGVITFNMPQQSLILDLLDAERKADPALEWFFADEREEPVIVKNLENIQGDERDVILFSTTYGVDAAGKLSMAFGALNADGGEKRLNVAVTRARAELHVFSSITADQIDLTRTGARGVRDLKAFLDFADRGAVALAARDMGSVGPADSPFEEAVAEALSDKGWEVHGQIGVSGFRIDLAVRHPDHTGVWLAGVECDGARYHSSATARDRDRIRQAMLEGLGWSILRIWSTDWFRDPATTAGRVDARLRELLELDRARRLEAVETQSADPEEAEAAPMVVMAVAESAPEATHVGTSDEPLPPEEPAEEPALVRFASAETLAPAGPAPRGRLPEPDAERFFEPDYTPRLAEMIRTLIEDEGPMTEAALARRISQLHGWQRTGARIQARVAAQHHLLEAQEEGGIRFLWLKGAVAQRTPFRGIRDRAIREISRTEIAWLEDQFAPRVSEAEDPTFELSRLIGIARLSQDARKYIEACRAWRMLGTDAPRQ